MRVIIISDLHFGVQETSMNDRKVRLKIIETIAGLLPVERIVLLGDIFDIDLARLGDAIDGLSSQGRNIVGLRRFINECFNWGIKNPQWVYIPGNHDYDMFDVPVRLEGMNRRFSKKTVGKILSWGPRSWEGGNIAPPELRDKFVIQYPHRWEKIGTKYILLTHGHYLDPSQTIGKKITELNKPGGMSTDKFFTLCAQYQTLAHAISYRGETIRLFGDLYKYWEMAGSFFKTIKKYGTVGLFRDKPLDRGVQNAALAYIKHFGPIGKPPQYAGVSPDALIFGHTHKEGFVFLDEGRTKKVGLKKGVLLVNDGGFIHGPSGRNIVGSFVEADSKGGGCRIRLHVFKRESSGEISKDVVMDRPV